MFRWEREVAAVAAAAEEEEDLAEQRYSEVVAAVAVHPAKVVGWMEMAVGMVAWRRIRSASFR